jgi:hypothetical protein
MWKTLGSHPVDTPFLHAPRVAIYEFMVYLRIHAELSGSLVLGHSRRGSFLFLFGVSGQIQSLADLAGAVNKTSQGARVFHDWFSLLFHSFFPPKAFSPTHNKAAEFPEQHPALHLRVERDAKRLGDDSEMFFG